MKLDSVPSVRVRNLSANLAAFFANNKLLPVSLDQRRSKKLEQWYTNEAVRASDLRARGFYAYHVEPSEQMLELKWERYSDPVWQTTSIRINVKELTDMRMDESAAMAAERSRWLNLRVYNFGDSCSFRWVLPKKAD